MQECLKETCTTIICAGRMHRDLKNISYNAVKLFHNEYHNFIVTEGGTDKCLDMN